MTWGGYTNTRTVTNPYGTQITLPTRDERMAMFPSSPAPAPAPAPSALSPEQQSARAILQGSLDQWSLGALAGQVWDWYLGGMPLEQIQLEIRKTPEWKSRFGVIDQLAQRGRAISESQVIDLERTYASIMRAAGLPSGFYDAPDDFARFIGNEVSPAEFADRVALAQRAAFQAPPELRSEMTRLFGAGGDGNLTAYFLDPDRALPLIQQQFQAADISTRANAARFGALTQDEAMRLAQEGVTADQASEGFGNLYDARELFGALDQGEDQIGRGEQLGATFTNDAAARERIRRRAERRRATFEGGGSFATSKEGFSGIGTADA